MRTIADAPNSTVDWPPCHPLHTTLTALEGSESKQRSRAKQDDPQGWKDAADHRQQHLQRGLRASLLGNQQPLLPDLVGLHAQKADDAGPQLLRLDHRLDEVVELLDSGALAHLVQRLEAWPAQSA